MPILNVKVSAIESPEMSSRISGILLDLTSRILGKDPRVTSIYIDYVDPNDWIVGGRSLSEQGKSSIYFDVKITDETNTKAEKAQFIFEAFSAFLTLLGDLHDESCIYVQDVTAAGYGYEDKTQEHRYQHA